MKESPSEAALENSSWAWPAINLQVIFWAFCGYVVILSSFLQKEFFNPEVGIPFYAVLTAGQFAFSLFLIFFERWRNQRNFWWMLYLLNTILITTIMVSVHWNQSMFFLMYLVNIVSAGLTLRSRGSYIVGLLSIVGFDLAVLLSPQAKLMNYIFSLVINNSALVLVAYLSGQLNDYLDNLGLRLDSATRDFRNIKNLHELILRSIPSGVLTVDAQGELVQGNGRAREILTEQYLEDKEMWKSLWKVLQDKTSSAESYSEFPWKPSETERKILRLQKAPIQSDEDQAIAEVYVIEDVTKMREIEDVLKNQEKLAAIGKLAAGIAHEIRNPLASISGSVQLLSAQAGTEEDKKLFNIVIRETDRLNLLISEFLDYAKPLPKPSDRISLTALLFEVLELVSYNKKLRGDVIQERLIDSEEVFILGYKDKLKQALLNIIINAYQAMDKIPNPRLRIQIQKENGFAVLRICDTGSGMKEETRRRIFEPFFTTKSQGTGLGLAVTHQIFEGHGASIMVESEEGVGTEFVIKVKEADKIK